MYRSNIMRLLAITLLAVAFVACGDKGKDGDKKDSTATKGADSASTSNSTESTGGGSGEKVTSEKGNFSATLPEGFPAVTESSVPVQTAVGSLDMITYMSASPTSACMIAYADYPTKAFEGTDLEVMLDSTRSGAIAKLNGTVQKEEKITLNGHPGRSVYFKGASGAQEVHGRFDYYIVKPRLYQVGYLSGNESDLTAPGVDAYFKSFALTQAEASPAGDASADTGSAKK